MTLTELAGLACQPQTGHTALTSGQIQPLLALLPGWSVSAEGSALQRRFGFHDFEQTLDFINAVGAIAQGHDHHPELRAGYAYCELSWSTHDIGGLSLNDFICAAGCQLLMSDRQADG